MEISVEEILENGGTLKISIIVGSAPTLVNSNNLIAAEHIKYKAPNSNDFITVLPKSEKMKNEDAWLMRGMCKELFINENDEVIFDIPPSKIYLIRSAAWLKAEQKIQEIKSNNALYS